MKMSEKEYDENIAFLHEEDDEHAIARCEECGELIYEGDDDVYIDDNGNFFCSLECALDYYSIRKVDDN